MIIIQENIYSEHSLNTKQKSYSIKADKLFKEDEESICFNKSLGNDIKCKEEEYNYSNQTMIFTDVNVSKMNTESNLRALIDQSSHLTIKEFNQNELQYNTEAQFSFILPERKNDRNEPRSICYFMFIACLIDIILCLLLFERYFKQLQHQGMFSSIQQLDFQYKYIYHNYNELLYGNN